MKQTGYIDGQNVTIEFRWAEGHYDRLPEMAADLVRRKVAVLVSTGGSPSVIAAKAATATIAHGMGAASLWVARDNFAARRFYDRFGGTIFAEKQEEHGDFMLAEVAYCWPDVSTISEVQA